MTDKSTMQLVVSIQFAKELAKFIMFMALTFLIMYLPSALDATIEREAEATRDRITQESMAWRSMTDERLKNIETLLTGRSAAIMGEVHEGRVGLQKEVQRLNDEVIQLTATTREEIQGLGTETRKTIREVRHTARLYGEVPGRVGSRFDYWTDCTAAGANAACWQVQFTGTLGSTRATMGAAARTSRSIHDSLPSIIGSVEASARNSERTTEATRQLMVNLSDSFKPLPKWVRIPLQVAAPTSQIAIPFLLK